MIVLFWDKDSFNLRRSIIGFPYNKTIFVKILINYKIIYVMAEMKIGFVTFNPGSGDGDQAVTVSGEKYEGRVQRTQQVEFGAESGGC